MAEHLIFFDGECPFCHAAVRHILELDVDRLFLFAPLEGETAKEVLTGPQKGLLKANSVVLAENYLSTEREFFIRSKAILRIYWLIGHGWGLFGIFSFFPSWILDPFYQWFAEHRHQFRLKIRNDFEDKDRFLP